MKPEFECTNSVSETNQILPGEIIIGLLISVDQENRPLVDFAENPISAPLVALTTVEVHKKHIGRQVALLFANGDPKSPVIMGLIHSPLDVILENHNHNETTSKETVAEIALAETENMEELKIDGKRIVIEGKEEIELKCGESSIVLTKTGKILIRGKYLLSRSSGVNRIMGGSVQVN